jgi:hypothetical protein
VPTGSELSTDLERLLPEYSDSVSAEKTRALGHASVRLKEIAAEIRSLDENFFLVSSTFPTVASRSPNRYSLPDDFGDIRWLERVVSESGGTYERVYPVGSMEHKDGRPTHTESDSYLVDSSAATGKPASYLLGGDFLQLYPIGDSTYSCRLWYDKTLADVAASVAIPLPLPFYPAILYGTAVEERLYRRDDTLDMEMRYERALSRALRSLEQRQDDGPRRVVYQEHPDEYC